MTKTKQPSGFSLIEGIIIVAIVCVIAGLGYFALSARQNDSSRKDEGKTVASETSFKNGRTTFYVASGGLGGYCSYYVADKYGKKADECVDGASLKQQVLDTNKTYRNAVDGYGSGGDTNLLLIDADIVVKAQKARNGSQYGDPKTVNTLVFSQVYSVKVSPISQP